MGKINFLQQSIKQTKKSIRDIDDSYNNEWDILAELCQNSIDAIRKKGVKKGVLKLLVDSQNKSIEVSDNGCGISEDKLPVLLAPFSTDKDDDEDAIGEKGVGLTFVIFSCNSFYIKSGDGKTTSEGTILDASNWKNSNSSDDIELNVNKSNDILDGTKVILKEVILDDIFQLSFNQLKYVLRTRTAIGNTNKIWDKDIDIEIKIEHINQDGEKKEEKIEFEYFLPLNGFNKNTIISIDDFYEYIKTDRTDKQKRDKLFGKIIYKKGKFEHNGRTIKYWSCFVPQRKSWGEISKRNNLCTDEQLANAEWIEKNGYTMLHSGIHTSVKGMPTGIFINNPITGSQSYWAQIFILFDDKHIKFDIGRKALPGRQSEIYKKKGHEIFNEYAKLFKYVGRKDIETRASFEKNEIFAEIEKELDLNSSFSKFLKVPSKQEASVAGLFFECIGNEKIKSLNPLSSGYKGKYDLYAKWGDRQVVIEFKSKLKNIISDFNDEVKMFDELDCIVCWGVDEEDERAFKSKNISIEKIELNELITNNEEFPNATHKLILSFVDPIYIIDMKQVINTP